MSMIRIEASYGDVGCIVQSIKDDVDLENEEALVDCSV